MLSLGAVFTLLFVTLGPLKILGPFAQRTAALDQATTSRIALLAFAIGVVAVVLGGMIGRSLMESWNVSIPSMLIGGGIIFFLVGLGLVLEQYEPQHASQPALPDRPFAAAMQVQLGRKHRSESRRTQFLLNFQPVVPIKLNADWTLISRTIVPVLDPRIPESGAASRDPTRARRRNAPSCVYVSEAAASAR